MITKKKMFKKNKIYIAIISSMIIICLLGDNVNVIYLWLFQSKVYFSYYKNNPEEVVNKRILKNCSLSTLKNYILQVSHNKRKIYAIFVATERGNKKIIPFLLELKNSNTKSLNRYCEIAVYMVKNEIKHSLDDFIKFFDLSRRLSNTYNIPKKLSIPLIVDNLSKKQDIILDRATICFDNKKYQKAFTINYIAAENKNAIACYNIGVMLYDGNGVKKNYPGAFYYFNKAAKLGNSEAVFVLAQMYEMGISCKKNPQKVLELYKKAAALGHKQARQILNMK